MNAFEFGQIVGEKIAAGPMQQMATNTANKAIQSPMGQKVLGGVATGYNKLMPQAGKNFVSRQMPRYAEPDDMALMRNSSKMTPTPYKPLGWEHGTHINSQTVTQNDELVKDQIDSHTPARVTGSPLQQIGFGLSGGQMPAQTFPRGAMAGLNRRVENDKLTQNNLGPLNTQMFPELRK